MEQRFHRIRSRTGRPFFLSVNYVAPHVGVNDLDRGDQDNDGRPDPTGDTPDVTMPSAPRSAYSVPLISGITHGAGVLRNGTTEPGVGDKPGRFATFPELTPATAAAVAADTRARAASVYVMDQNIARLIRQLKATGEWRRTIFVFWSDNGYFQGEHHRPFGKVYSYEPVLRVPILITGPGMRGGAHDGAYGGQDRYDPMSVVDLSHTIVDWAKATPPHRMDGKSMVRVLRSHDTGWRDVVPVEGAYGYSPRLPGNTARDRGFPRLVRTSHGVKPMRDGIVDPRTYIGFRTGRWLYVRYDDAEAELYDLWTDPAEWNNLAARPGWTRRHAKLMADLDRVWRQTRNCTGRACYAPLPRSLRVSAAQSRSHTKAFWASMARLYDY
jgi:hypothetical protein